MARLLLWDVDNTLIDNAGVSKQIYAEAFRLATSRTAIHPARTEGRTDPEIMADMLVRNDEPAVSWPRLEAALQQAGRQLALRIAERGRALSGAVDLVAALAQVGEVVQTVVTGNIRANALVKLAPFGLLEWLDLDVGAYGSDAGDRARLVGLARARAEAKYGPKFGLAGSAVVIGDTVRDVAAAQTGSLRVLAVASGIHSEDELRLAGATCVVPGLGNTTAARTFLLQSTGG